MVLRCTCWLASAALCAAWVGWAGPAHASGGVPDGTSQEEILDTRMRTLLAQKLLSAGGIVYLDGDRQPVIHGYGTADSRRGDPILPERSRFLLGSVTKIFTRIALLQLYQQGAIRSFEGPAQPYLGPVRLPRPAGHDITIEQLMLHTSGLEDALFGLYGGAPLGEADAAAQLTRYLPGVIPGVYGSFVSYSNWNAAVLGTLVSRASGMRYEQWMARRVFEPLGMSGCVFAGAGQLPENLVLPSEGSSLGEGEIDVHGLSAQMVPAMGLACSLRDIARFMSALLAGGGSHLPAVSGQTLAAAVQLRARNNPAVNSGGAWLMNSLQVGEDTLLWAEGLANDTTSLLVLHPRSRRGVFFVAAGGERYSQVALVDFVQLTPEVLPLSTKPAAVPLAARWDRYAGTYAPLRRYRHTAEAFLEFVYPSSTLQVTRADDRHITVNGIWQRHVGGNVFHNELLGLDLDPKSFRTIQGRRYLLTNYHVYEQIPWFRKPLVERHAVEAASIAAALAFVVLAALRRRSAVGWVDLACTGVVVALLVAFWRIALQGITQAAAIWQLASMDRSRLIALTVVVDGLLIAAVCCLVAAVLGLTRRNLGTTRSVYVAELVCGALAVGIVGVLLDFHVPGWQLP